MTDQYDRTMAWAKSDGSDHERDPKMLIAEDLAALAALSIEEIGPLTLESRQDGSNIIITGKCKVKLK